ncbi:MAG TPA: hypothetical protein VKT78_13945 [Fimbriimonadaceae bacterium]|nr:hypothetical protein [Fimbriimonadaceae bacterium]
MLDSIDASVRANFFTCAATVAESLAKAFNCDMESHLAPEFEAIRNGLGNAVDGNVYTFQSVYIDAGSISRQAHNDRAHGYRTRFRDSPPVRHGYPHLMRKLRAKAMKAERRQEAHHTVGLRSHGLNEGMGFRYLEPGQGVESASGLDDLATLHEVSQAVSVYSKQGEVTRSNDTAFARQL